MILGGLPELLKKEFLLELRLKYVKSSLVFQECDISFMIEIASNLHRQIYCPEEDIVIQGEMGREMYMIQSGLLKVTS